MWGMIATWRMAYEGMTASQEILAKGGTCGDALEKTIALTEDYPYYSSVGYGGLPNLEGEVSLDAAYMDGDTFQLGAVAGIQDIANPIKVARALSKEKFNSFLIGDGAKQYATAHGFEGKQMLTDRAQKQWLKRVQAIADSGLDPYDGHDTIGMVTLDQQGSMAVGTSSSGLFMKKPGRVGDSPLSGSGFYCDSEIGGCAATGLGEDLMKGCLSYEVVRLMGEGAAPQAACQQALETFAEKLKARYGKAGAMSLVAMDRAGRYGIATNVEFSFCVATEAEPLKIMLADVTETGEVSIQPASQEWLKRFLRDMKQPLD